MARILLIDDEDDLLDVCQYILEVAGHAVETVVDVKRKPLMEAVLAFKPDLILLDLVMPLASGEEVARWLRAEEATRQIPILVVSAHAAGEQRARALDAAGFLAKPFTDDEYVAAVDKTLREQQLAAHPGEEARTS